MSENNRKDDDNKKDDKGKTNPVGNFFKGAGIGALSMFGMGPLFETGQELQNTADSAQQSMQDSISQLTLSLYNNIQRGEKLNENVVKLLTQQKAETNETIKYYSLLSKYSLFENNIFIKFVYILVFIIIFFMLTR
jgi:hypothetical protein